MADQVLSKQKEAQQVQRWHDRISVSKKWRDQISDQNKWEIYLKELENKYDVVLGNMQVPPIGEMFAYKDTMLANLYYKDPYITVNAKKDATIQSAYILEAGVNHLWSELKMKREIELQITDALFVGHAWNKVGNNVKTTGSGDFLRIADESIYSNRVSWTDMFMNPGCKQPPKDCAYLAQRIYLPTDDVKEKYGSVAKDLVGAPHPTIDKKYTDNILYRDDFNYTALYEIWDAREQKIFTIAEGLTNKYLEDPKPWPEYLDEYGFQMLSFHEIPDKPYPQSDIAAWEPQVLEKIKIFTMMLNHVKRWNRQMVMLKGTMGLQELDKFEKGIDGAILVANKGDVQTAFKLLDFGSLPPDIYMILDRLDQVIDRVRGQSQFQQGGVTKTATRTSSELELIKGGADARTDRKQDRIENHCGNIARHLVTQMKNNFDVSYYAKVTGKEPPEIIKAFAKQGIYDPRSKTIKFTSNDIKGEFDVSIKAGSTLPLDKMTRDAILDKVMQTGAQMASIPAMPPFMVEVIKERLRDYEIPSLSKAFDDQQAQADQKNQMQSQEADVNTQKVQAEAAKRTAQAQSIQLDTVIKGVQAAGKATGELNPEVSLTK